MNHKKKEILLLTHGGWGTKLIQSLKMIIGEIDGVYEIALNPSDTFKEFYERVKSKLEEMPEDSLVITDIFGGTTSNVAVRLSMDFKVNVVSGLNAPMLLEAITLIDNDEFDFADKLVDAGRASCKNVKKEVNFK